MAHDATHRGTAELRFCFGELTPLGEDLILTRMDLCIWQCLARRMSTIEIGRELFIAPKTVKNHLYALYQVLGVARMSNPRTRAAVLGWFMMARFPALATPVTRR